MSEPVTVLARLRAKKGLESRLRQELHALVAPTLAEAGCLNYDLHESAEEAGLFLFYENWKSQADLDAHFQTPHLRAAVKIMPELVEGDLELTKWKKVA
jgi:quinol monooxygenase YgiN